MSFFKKKGVLATCFLIIVCLNLKNVSQKTLLLGIASLYLTNVIFFEAYFSQIRLYPPNMTTYLTVMTISCNHVFISHKSEFICQL